MAAVVHASLTVEPIIVTKTDTHLLLVDSGVAGSETLLAGIEPGFETVHLVSSDIGGLAAVSLAIRGHGRIKSLHILSHGTPGCISTAAGTIDADALSARPDLVARIAECLDDDADVVLYGCSIAAGQTGQNFVDRFSRMLGRRVEAADGPVGSADLNGSWAFPGSPRMAFSEPARAAYPGVLATATFGTATTINTTTTLTSNESGTTISVTRSDGVQMAGVSSGFLDPGVIGNTVTYTLTFSSTVTITQFDIGEFKNNSASANYTFTPNSGSAVTIADDSGDFGGAVATLNPVDWNNISSFTVSYAGADTYRVGIDNIAFTPAAVAPGTLATPDLLAASDAGTSNTDNITNSTTQQLSGSATTGETISILVGGTTVNTVTATGGSWSYTHTLTEGSYAITALATNGTGAGPASTALNIVVDTTAPLTLGPADLLAASDLGSSSSDNITSSTTQQLSGSATTGDLVSIMVGGTTANVVTAAGGSWSYTHTLTAGSYAITVQATDTAGNASTASSALGIVIDTTPPGTVGTPDLIAGSDTGTSNTDNITSTALPTFTGTGALANSLVHVLVGGTTAGSVTTSGTGAWTFTLTSTLAAGTSAITVRAEDTAGNDGPASAALNIVVDTTAPAAPGTLATPDLIASSDTGASSTDNDTTDTTPSFVGTNATGSALHALVANGVTVGMFTSDAGGTFSVTATTLAAGSYAIGIRELDTAGNASATSPALGVVISAPVVDNGGGGGGGGGGDSGGGSSGGTTTTTTPTTPATPLTPTTTTTESTLASGTQVTTATQTISNTGTGSGLAAIVENTGNNSNVVTATLPVSTSIVSEGPTTAQTGDDAVTTLVNAVDARDSTSESTLISGAQTFLNRLASTTTLDVRTIIPTSTSSSVSDPIVITGTSAADGSTQSEAFVFDLRTINSSSGSVSLQLDNIEFASVIGQATIFGGSGANYATADDNAQFISLGEGDDTLFGGAGNDTVGSGSGADSLAGEEGDDRVFGGTGDDTTMGGSGSDVVYGNQNNDVLYGNQGTDTLFGGQDADRAFGGQDADIIYGNFGSDTLSGQLADDTVYGGQGDDFVFGGDGNDVLVGNKANDVLSGGQGDDTIYGSDDFDVLYGGVGDDNLDGGSGDDTLYGGAAGSGSLIDVLNGGEGDDVIYGGEGVDWIYLGAGSDAIYIEDANGFDVVTDFDAASGDTIHISTNVNKSGIVSFSDIQAAATDNGDGDVEIAMGSNNYVRLIGVNAGQLSEDMFQFF